MLDNRSATINRYTQARAAHSPTLARSTNLQPWRQLAPPSFHRAFESPDDVRKIDEGRRLCLFHDPSANAQWLFNALDPDFGAKDLPFTLASARACRVARMRIIETALPIFQERFKQQGKLWFVTFFLPGFYQPVGRLHLLDPKKLRGQVRSRIIRASRTDARCANPLVIGMVENSIRVDQHGQPAGHQLHMHFVCDEAGKLALRQRKVRPFGLGPEQVWTPYYPLNIPSTKEIARRLAYSLKAQTRTWNPYRQMSNSTGEAGPVHQHEVQPDLMPETLIWMDRWSLSDLILAMGTRKLRPTLKMQW